MTTSKRLVKKSLKDVETFPKTATTAEKGMIKFPYVMLLALVAISAGVWFAQWQQAGNKPELEALQAELENTLVFPDDYKTLPAFQLVNEDGQSIDQTSFDQQWSMLFFGFTQCPDVCPITLAVLRDALKLIAEDSPETSPFEIVFTSVDPNRDPPEVLKPYISGFNTNVRAMTGELNDVLGFAKAMNIVVAYNADENDSSHYSVDHTASILLIDPDKNIRAKFNVPHEPDKVASDYIALLSNLQ